MNRLLKFRVWDTYHKYVKPQYFYSHDSGLATFFQWVANHGAMENVEQFTGLKDNSDKEIYEGDIIKYLPDGFGYRVMFEDGCFLLQEIGIPGFASFSNCGPEHFFKQKDMLIIGNIHEPVKEKD